ncbi:MAG TPA: hypothetical protein VH583_12995 [Vicinamibacterales bacterium]
MSFIRRRLIAYSTVWLLLQLTALAAFVPSDCCETHRPRAAEDCHKAAATACPMHAADGAECPMHADETAPDKHCSMRGLCNAPAVALASLFSQPGVLSHVTTAAPVEQISPLQSTSVQLSTVLVRHDTPPPRS